MREDLDSAIQAIHVRFGEHSLQRATRLPATESWPCGSTAVDFLSGIGGLPKGRLSVLSGPSTSGKLSLGLGLLARASHEFARVVVIDPEACFDPWALAPLGADLSPLTLIRPPDLASTGEAATALARAGAGFLLLLGSLGEADLSPLEAASARSGVLVVAVVDACPRPLAHASSLTLGVERSDWIFERGQLVGLRARLRCLKNKLAPPVGEADLEVRYPLGAQVFFPDSVRSIRSEEEARPCPVRSAAV